MDEEFKISQEFLWMGLIVFWWIDLALCGLGM
jgi:hypothetical protein